MARQLLRPCLWLSMIVRTILSTCRTVINWTLSHCIMAILAPLTSTVGFCGTYECRLLKHLIFTLRFLVADHTKNKCDGSFGLFQQLLKTRNVNSLSEMMAVLHNSPPTSLVIDKGAVQRTYRKSILNTHPKQS